VVEEFRVTYSRAIFNLNERISYFFLFKLFFNIFEEGQQTAEKRKNEGKNI
jgi:hypothetical protein